MKQYLKYLPWLGFVVAAIVLLFTVKGCVDARQRERKAEKRLSDVLADSARVDSVMAYRKAQSDSVEAHAKKAKADADKKFKRADSLVAHADSVLAELERRGEPTGSDSGRAEQWKSRYGEAIAVAGRLRASITDYQVGKVKLEAAYDSMSNVAYQRANERDDWKARAKKLETESAAYLAAVHDARCIVRWPVRVCPSPTATFVVGAVTGGVIVAATH